MTDEIKPAATDEEAFEALMHVVNVDDLTGVAHRIDLRVPDLFDYSRARANARALATELRKVANRLIDSTRVPDQTRIRQLYSIHGEDAGIWWCERCRLIRYSEEDALTCCGPRRCKKCDTQYKDRAYHCDRCWREEETRKAAARWAKATPVPFEQYEGDVFYVEEVDGSTFGHHEGWFYGFEELCDYLDDWRFDNQGEDLPTIHIFGAAAFKTVLDAERFVENATEEMHEDALAEIPTSAIEEMQTWLDGWAERHSPTSYNPDYSVKIVDWEAHYTPTEEENR
jgi:hypothetical protein